MQRSENGRPQQQVKKSDERLIEVQILRVRNAVGTDGRIFNQRRIMKTRHRMEHETDRQNANEHGPQKLEQQSLLAKQQKAPGKEKDEGDRNKTNVSVKSGCKQSQQKQANASVRISPVKPIFGYPNRDNSRRQQAKNNQLAVFNWNKGKISHS